MKHKSPHAPTTCTASSYVFPVRLTGFIAKKGSLPAKHLCVRILWPGRKKTILYLLDKDDAKALQQFFSAINKLPCV